MPCGWPCGTHTISVSYHDPLFAWDDYEGPAAFTVSEAADICPGQVRVDQEGLFQGDPLPDQTINPAQDTVLWAAWFVDMAGFFGGPPVTMQDLKADVAAGAAIYFQVDGGGWLPGRMSPFRTVCANGLLNGLNDTPLYHRTWGPSK